MKEEWCSFKLFVVVFLELPKTKAVLEVIQKYRAPGARCVLVVVMATGW